MPTNANALPPAADRESIDRLVREVMRRLGEMNTRATIGSTTTESTPCIDKIVTAASIEKIPSTQKQLSVRADSIVTPAARDEAQRRGIAIVRSTPTESTKSNSTTNQHPNQRGGISDAMQPERAASVTAQLLRRGIANVTTRIVLSETPGRDVYQQCAEHNQRGVMVTSMADVDRFAAELSPTCWVLDMKRLNISAATNVAARIAQLERSTK